MTTLNIPKVKKITFEQQADFFSQQDADYLCQYRSLLLNLEDKIVGGFYDAFISYPGLNQAHSEHSERKQRETILRNWWQKTLTNQIDGDFWYWQMLVSETHAHPLDSRWHNAWEWQFFGRYYQTTIPQTLSMWDWLLTILSQELNSLLSTDEQATIHAIFNRLGFSVKTIANISEANKK